MPTHFSCLLPGRGNDKIRETKEIARWKMLSINK